MRHLDPTLSKLLAERKVTEAQSRPRPTNQTKAEKFQRLRRHLGSLLISAGERLAKRETELA